ncbi:MAG: sigma-E processing peptidase SpoIIGA [Clostridia bacterium]|nr:sigma-E processing peptidase SpoIIGA [Clostridia bacterium]
MVVYVEYVLLDNFFIDLILLNCALKIYKKPISKLRLIFCSILGGIISLTYPLFSSFKVLSILIKVVSGLLITLLVTNFKGVKDYFRFFILFFTLTATVGGLLIAIFEIFNVNYSSNVCIAIIIAPVYCLVKFIYSVIKFLEKRGKVVNNYLKVEVIKNNKILPFVGFLDTGNQLYYKNSPVIITDKTTADKIISFSGLKNTGKIRAHTVLGEAQMMAFSLECIKVYFGKSSNIYNNVWVAISKEKIFNDYSFILHSSMQEVESDKLYNSQTKKVS